jgi:hypothetical protein
MQNRRYPRSAVNGGQGPAGSAQKEKTKTKLSFGSFGVSLPILSARKVDKETVHRLTSGKCETRDSRAPTNRQQTTSI